MSIHLLLSCDTAVPATSSNDVANEICTACRLIIAGSPIQLETILAGHPLALFDFHQTNTRISRLTIQSIPVGALVSWFGLQQRQQSRQKQQHQRHCRQQAKDDGSGQRLLQTGTPADAERQRAQRQNRYQC